MCSCVFCITVPVFFLVLQCCPFCWLHSLCFPRYHTEAFWLQSLLPQLVLHWYLNKTREPTMSELEWCIWEAHNFYLNNKNCLRCLSWICHFKTSRAVVFPADVSDHHQSCLGYFGPSFINVSSPWRKVKSHIFMSKLQVTMLVFHLCNCWLLKLAKHMNIFLLNLS